VRHCRESGNDRAAELHIIWIDLLLEEWQRCRQPVQTIVDQQEEDVERK
jgi:hypothetical protein